MNCTLFAQVVFLIVYTLLINTGCFSLPVSEISTNEAKCHKDFDAQSLLSECTLNLKSISVRYHYDSIRNKCVQTITCSLGFDSTHESIEECENACIETTLTEQQGNVCTVPTLKNGNVITTESCHNAATCSAFFTCNPGYDLYPVESRIKKFDCFNGVWRSAEDDEPLAVFCAKIDITVHVDGTLQNYDETVDDVEVEIGKEVTLSCSVEGDVDPDSYNITWMFQSDDNDDYVTIGDSNQIVLTNVNNTREGKYSCLTSGSIQDDGTNSVYLKVNPLDPAKNSFFFINQLGNTVEAVCVCIGGNNVKSNWTIDGREVNSTKIQHTSHVVDVLTTNFTNSGTYLLQCECKNDYGVDSKSKLVEIEESRNRRDTDEFKPITSGKINSFCEHGQETAIVAGHVVRQTRSIIHFKVQNVLAPKSKATKVSNDILRVHSNGHQRFSRNQRYILKLESRGDEHRVLEATYHVDNFDEMLQNICH